MLKVIPNIKIVSTRSSPRLLYILDHIFSHFLGVSYHIISSIPADGTPYILYGNDHQDLSALQIPAHELLFELGHPSFHLDVHQQDGLHKSMMVAGTSGKTFDFDLFAWLFYLLSRYEEYQSEDLDDHDRYKSSNSLASKYGFLEVPIVDYWIQQLCKEIEAKFGIDLWPPEQGKIKASIDIDMPYAYHKKGMRAYLGMFRDLLTGNIGGVLDRWAYLTTGKDPFDTYEGLRELLKNCAPTFIFLLQNYNPPHDLNHLIHHPEWKGIISDLSSWATLGIHPSYPSHQNITILESEKNNLENTIGEVIHSRQHFLKITLPETFRNLITTGIKHEHSMMYPDRVGFRASTSRPFYWYDLVAEEATDLLIHPYAVMDVTLRYYMNLSPSEAILKVDKLQKTLDTVNGDLGILWHNSSMSRAYGWKKWMRVLEYITQK